LLRKTVSEIMLALLLASILTLVFNVQPVKASGTIYIRRDGSVDPPVGLISTFDNITYTLTANVFDHIVVERSNIVLDGVGYTVQHPGGSGISLEENNITIKNMNIRNCFMGIFALSYSKNKIFGNNITECTSGIELASSSGNNIHGNDITSNYIGIELEFDSQINIIFGNNITSNDCGIKLLYSSYNSIYHNNFVNNTLYGLRPAGTGHIDSTGSVNTWDDGYPSGGNYWSGYSGNDTFSGPHQNVTGSDGISDTPYVIDANNQDLYPLMGPFNEFDAGTWNDVSYSFDIVSNSTVSDFLFNPSEGAFIRYSMSGESGTVGFCRITIPKDLLWVENGWNVTANGEPVNYTVTSDENCTYIYFAYKYDRFLFIPPAIIQKTVEIRGTHAIPEFPSAMLLQLFIILTLLAVVITKKRLHRKTKTLIFNPYLMKT